MVISQNMQMWLIVSAVVLCLIAAIIFWLWENVLRLFYEIQRDTGKKYSKKQWFFIWLIGILIISFIMFIWIKFGINLA